MSAVSPAAQNRFYKAIPRISYAAATTNGTGFSWAGFRHALFVLDTGVLGAAATVDVKIQECATIGGTYVDVAGAVFTQRVKATDDDKVFFGEMQLGGRLKFLRAVLTVGAAASIVGVHAILSNPDRTERIVQAQGGSEAVAGPIGSVDFSIAT